MVGSLYEGIHEPELYGLNVLCLKIGVVHLAHDAAPTAGGVHQGAAVGDTGTVGGGGDVVVVGTLLLRVVGQVELINVGGLSRNTVFVGEDFLLIDATRIGL